MKIRPNERVLIAGKTGSGKTWLAHKLLAHASRLIVVDPKGNLTKWGLKEPNFWDWKAFERGKPARLRIVPPIGADPDWFEEFFARLYNYGNLTLYIDEVYGVTPPGAKPGMWLSALYTRGRERGIGVWAATQRPVWVPLFLISEADWMLIFRLNLYDDRKRIASIAGDSILETIPDPHGLWLYHVDMDDPVYYQSARTSVLAPEKDV